MNHPAYSALVAHRQKDPLRLAAMWKQMGDMRVMREQDKMYWPAQCFVPSEKIHNIFGCDENKLDHLFGVWRMSLGIYRFDESVYPALISTPVPEDIPTEVFGRLPEWCIYIECPTFPSCSVYAENEIKGLWVLTDYEEKKSVLAVYAHTDDDEIQPPYEFTIEKGMTIKQSLESLYKEREGYDVFMLPIIRQHMMQFLAHALSLILWVCSDDPDISKLKDRQPMPQQYAPQPIKSKKGFRFCPPAAPTHYVLGARIGGEIRDGIEAHGKNSGGEDQRRRAHIRRAHWHGYWKGKRDGQQVFDVRWIPPILVSGKS